MPIIKIAPAKREGMKLLISLFGLSETGKTYSALRLAAGIEPDANKRGLLDTEGGERGRAYVDAIPGGYMYGSLTAPFTPERYIEALNDFVAAGVTTLVVDSVSHAWFAAGGILDMVENAAEKNDMAKWAKPKRRLGKLTGQWLGCGLHLILCARGKQPLTEEFIDGRKKLVPGPVVPVQEKSLRFDLTIMAHMLGDGRFSVDRADGGKCPGPLRGIFAAGEVMDEDMGRRLIDWIGGQDAVSPAQRQVRIAAEQAAAEGAAAFTAFWRTVPRDLRDYLRDDMDNFRSIATAADAEVERQRQEAAAAAAPTDAEDPFGSAATEKPALPAGVQKAEPATSGVTKSPIEYRVTLNVEQLAGCMDFGKFRPIEERSEKLLAEAEAGSRNDLTKRIEDALESARNRFQHPAAAA